MLPIFLNDLRQNNEEMVEVTLELGRDSVALCGIEPVENNFLPRSTSAVQRSTSTSSNGFLQRSTSTASRMLRMFSRRRSDDEQHEAAVATAREVMKNKAKLIRDKSSAQRALRGLRFISKSIGGETDGDSLWKRVEARFVKLAEDGLLSRDNFGECIGYVPLIYLLYPLLFFEFGNLLRMKLCS